MKIHTHIHIRTHTHTHMDEYVIKGHTIQFETHALIQDLMYLALDCTKIIFHGCSYDTCTVFNLKIPKHIRGVYQLGSYKNTLLLCGKNIKYLDLGVSYTQDLSLPKYVLFVKFPQGYGNGIVNGNGNTNIQIPKHVTYLDMASVYGYTNVSKNIKFLSYGSYCFEQIFLPKHVCYVSMRHEFSKIFTKKIVPPNYHRYFMVGRVEQIEPVQQHVLIPSNTKIVSIGNVFTKHMILPESVRTFNSSTLIGVLDNLPNGLEELYYYGKSNDVYNLPKSCRSTKYVFYQLV